jgi:hypothetical protein
MQIVDIGKIAHAHGKTLRGSLTRHLHMVPESPCVCPAKRQDRCVVRRAGDQATKPGVAVALKQPTEAFQMGGRMSCASSSPALSRDPSHVAPAVNVQPDGCAFDTVRLRANPISSAPWAFDNAIQVHPLVVARRGIVDSHDPFHKPPEIALRQLCKLHIEAAAA